MPKTRLNWQWGVLALWLLLIALFWLYAQRQEQGVLAILQMWLRQVAEGRWGPLVLTGIFLVRPLLLLPITILNVFAGFLFGPVWGLLYALVATLLSSAIAYALGRVLGKPPETSNRKFLHRLRTRSFDTVLTSRLISLPGDLVNYAAGFMRISFWAFILATAIGGLPGLLVSVLAGASLEGPFSFGGVHINAWYLLASAALLIGSLSLSWWLRRRARDLVPGADEE